MNADFFHNNVKFYYLKILLGIILSAILIFASLALLSCRNTGLNNENGTGLTAAGEITADPANNRTPESIFEPAQAANRGQGPIFLFDYKSIDVTPTKSIDVQIKNYNIFQDIYGELIIMGELKNNSKISKTNIETTFDFYSSDNKIIDSLKVKAFADFLQPGSRMPFYAFYDNRAKYINISEIIIGVNYKNYNKNLQGQAIVSEERFYYNNDIMTIEGIIINMGPEDIENIKLFAIFYNERQQVVFVRECHIETGRMEAMQKQEFSVSIMLDEYIMPFTSYGFEIFFRDSLKV